MIQGAKTNIIWLDWDSRNWKFS